MSRGREETVHDTNLMRVCPHGNAERACKAKVAKLEVVISIDQKILRFQVAMEDAMRVTIEQSRRQLMGEFLCRRLAMIHSVVLPVPDLLAGAWRAHARRARSRGVSDGAGPTGNGSCSDAS